MNDLFVLVATWEARLAFRPALLSAGLEGETHIRAGLPPSCTALSSTPGVARGPAGGGRSGAVNGVVLALHDRRVLGMEQNGENFTACLDWPRPQIAESPVSTRPPLLAATLLVLILRWELYT